MRSGAEQAMQEYSTSMTVSASKTKFMVVGREVTEEDQVTMPMNNDEIEHVKEFT